MPLNQTEPRPNCRCSIAPRPQIARPQRDIRRGILATRSHFPERPHRPHAAIRASLEAVRLRLLRCARNDMQWPVLSLRGARRRSNLNHTISPVRRQARVLNASWHTVTPSAIKCYAHRGHSLFRYGHELRVAASSPQDLGMAQTAGGVLLTGQDKWGSHLQAALEAATGRKSTVQSSDSRHLAQAQ